jgi:hypothetical protein
MANASELLTKNNPANKEVEPKGNRMARVPMSVVVRKLEVPEIPGYHTHWIKESNIPRALQAWYEFAEFDEVPINQRNPGMDTEKSGNTDLGARVSIAAGIGADSKPERLYLMKLKEEYWSADRKKIDSRNAEVLQGIFKGEQILQEDGNSRPIDSLEYVSPEATYHKPALFSRKRKKSLT